MENGSDCCMQLAIEGEKHMDNKAWDEAASCLEAALSKQSGDPRLTDLICAKLWASHFQMGNYGKSLEYVHHQLQIPSLSDDFEREARCVVKIGLTLSLLNRFEEASNKFEYLLEAAKSRSHEDFTGIAMYYLAQTNFKLATELEERRDGTTEQNSTGTLVQAHLWQAVSYFLKYKNLIIKDDKGGSPLEGKIYGSLAHVYFKLNQLEDALSCQLKCLQISQQFGDTEIQFSSISFLGTIYCCMQKYNEAAEAFEQSFYMAEQLNDDCRKAKALYRLANTMSMLNDHLSAIQVAEKYLHLVKLNSDDVGESNVYCFLCDQFRLVGDLEESLNYAQKYKQLTEKLEDWTGYELAVEVCEEIIAAIKQESSKRQDTSSELQNVIPPGDTKDKKVEIFEKEQNCDEEGLVGSPLTSSCSSCNCRSSNISLEDAEKAKDHLPVSESSQSLSLSENEHLSKTCARTVIISSATVTKRSLKSCRSCFNLSYGNTGSAAGDASYLSSEVSRNNDWDICRGIENRKITTASLILTDLDQLNDDDGPGDGQCVMENAVTQNLLTTGPKRESAMNAKQEDGKKKGDENVLQSSKRWHSNFTLNSNSCSACPVKLKPLKVGSRGASGNCHKNKHLKAKNKHSKVAAHISRAYNTSITFLRNREVKRLSRCGSEFEFDPSLIATKKSRVAATASTSAATTRITSSNDVKTTSGIDSLAAARVSTRCRAGIKETESLMEFITKAHSAGRIDDQQITMERLHAHHSYQKSKVFRTKSDGPVHMPRPQTLCVNANPAVTSSSSDSGCYEGTRSRYNDTTPAEKLIDQIVRSQSYRMNDQRSEGRHLPQSSSDQASGGPGVAGGGQGHIQGGGRVWSQSHEQSFLDLLERCQDSRFDDQRTVLRPLLNSSPSLSDNQFLDSIQRGQSSGRMEEQRTTLPPTLRQTMSCCTNSSSFLQPANSSTSYNSSPLSSTSVAAVAAPGPHNNSSSSSATTLDAHNISSSHSNSTDVTSFNRRQQQHVTSFSQGVAQSDVATSNSGRNSSNSSGSGGGGSFSAATSSSSSSQLQTVNSINSNSSFLTSSSAEGRGGDHEGVSTTATSSSTSNSTSSNNGGGGNSSSNNTGSSSSSSGPGSSGNSLFQRFRRGSSRRLEAVLSAQSKHSR